MTSDRIKEIQEQTAYPESRSVYQALNQVWNECEQEKSPKEIIWKQRERLIQLRTKLKFYHKLDDKIEQVLNTELDIEDWGKEVCYKVLRLEKEIDDLEMEMGMPDDDILRETFDSVFDFISEVCDVDSNITTDEIFNKWKNRNH